MNLSRALIAFLLLLSLGPLSRASGKTKEAGAQHHPSKPVHGTFSSVVGKVYVQSPDDPEKRRVRVKTTVWEKDKVFSNDGSTARVSLFDGSDVTVYPKTSMIFDKLQKGSDKDKSIRFSLLAGKLYAKVAKLLSPSSSFEIGAGGVVCGVRGTEFAVGFNPTSHLLDLDVFKGAVGAGSGGNIQVFTGGQSCHFTNGKWDGKVGTAPPPPKDPGKGDSGKGSSGGSDTGAAGGTTGGTDSGEPAAADNTNTGGSSPPPPVNSCLGDLNNQFQVGIGINQQNNLNSAQRNISIRLVVPGNEAP